MTEQPEGAVTLEVDEGIALVTISQPRRRNAMTYPMMAELFDAFARAAADPDVRVVVLTGADGTFCAGIDLTFLAGIPPKERGFPGRLHDERGWWNLAAIGKPVIAAVDGDAVGMGAEWSSMCDLRLATPRARFAWPFAQRGLVPDTGAGTWLLPRLVGVPTAMRLLMSGEWWSAAEAKDAGYVEAIVEPDDLLDAARALARRFLPGLPEAQTRIKRLLYDGLARDVLEHQAASRAELLKCFASAEHAQGLAAFLDRSR